MAISVERYVITALSGIMLAVMVAGQSHAATTPQPPRAPARPQSAIVRAQIAWRQMMQHRPQPRPGCFEASFPSPAWHTVKCVKPPTAPQAGSAAMVRPRIVAGKGGEYTANVAAAVSSMTGSFDNIQGVTQLTGSAHSQSNFALQLNTNLFNTTACQGTGCQGWEQFIFSNSAMVYIEYSLLSYGPSCPNGWRSYLLGSGKVCYFDTPATAVPVQSVGNLINLTLTGTATPGGNDTVTVATSPTKVYAASFADNVLTLAQGWGGASSGGTEFNIVGDRSASQTNFNPGSLVGVRLTNNASSPQVAPTCLTGGGTTAETNNLNLANDCSTIGQAIIFTEANTPLITSLSATTGVATGGTPITLTGSGFTGATAVTFFQGVFPATPAPSFTIISDNTINTVSPACPPTTCGTGTFGDIVTVTGPTGSGSAPQGFRRTPVVTGVVPNAGPPGTTVTVSGNGFSLDPDHLFTFGGESATNVDCPVNGNIQCTMLVPGPGSGTVPVLLDGTAGASFSYTSGPVATCSIQLLGCNAGAQSYEVTCGVPHGISVDGTFKTTSTTFIGQEAGAHQLTSIVACFPSTSNCQQFSTTSTETCPIGPPINPIKPLPNCKACIEEGLQCKRVNNGFVCVGDVN